MSLKHILLGLLEEPHSGYDIKKAFDQSLRNFWNAELSQIYPQLKKLEADGLVSSKTKASASGPQRRVYKRSAKGRRELLRWLADGPIVGDERISYLAQVFFLAAMDGPDKTLEFMTSLRTYMQQRLATLQAIEAGWSGDDPRYPDQLSDEDFYPQLTLALGIKRVQATVEWCDETLARIRKRQQTS